MNKNVNKQYYCEWYKHRLPNKQTRSYHTQKKKKKNRLLNYQTFKPLEGIPYQEIYYICKE